MQLGKSVSVLSFEDFVLRMPSCLSSSPFSDIFCGCLSFFSGVSVLSYSSLPLGTQSLSHPAPAPSASNASAKSVSGFRAGGSTELPSSDLQSFLAEEDQRSEEEKLRAMQLALAEDHQKLVGLFCRLAAHYSLSTRQTVMLAVAVPPFLCACGFPLQAWRRL